MKKFYEEPEMEIVEFNLHDIITTSGEIVSGYDPDAGYES